MADELLRFKNLIGRLIDTKQDKQLYIGGLLGKYDAGSKIVRVPNQPGYVYVRLNGSFSEVITAVNNTVAEVFDLKVIVTINPANPSIYVVMGRDLNQYSSLGTGNGIGSAASLPHHGDTHSFGNGLDPTFIFKRQMMQPLAAHPTNPISNHLYVEADYYIWKNQIKYFPGANTIDLTQFNPINNNLGRYVTVYLDGNSNTLAYLTGVIFSLSQANWPSIIINTGTLSTVVVPNQNIGIPLELVTLISGSASFDWGQITDIRSFLDGGGYASLPHALDPSGGINTGSLAAEWVIINDPGHYYTGTVTANQAFQEIGAKFTLVTNTVIGTGTSPRLAEWSATNTIKPSTVIKTGVGILTITTPIDQTLTLDGSIELALTGAIVNQPAIYDGSKFVPGKLALSAPSPFTFTLEGNMDIVPTATDKQALLYNASTNKWSGGDVAAGGGGGGSGHDHGVTRLNVISGTTIIPLLDFAQVIEYVSFNGFIVDGVTYSISTGSDYIVLDSPLNTNGIFMTSYQILSI